MPSSRPETALDERYSDAGAVATEWEDARAILERAEIFWISSVRPDGRPHVTPLIAVLLGDALYFTTGAEERKARNLARNPHCTLTTGCNVLSDGLDIAVEGSAVNIRDDARLEEIAAAYVAKYGEGWRFEVRDGAFHHGGSTALVFELVPTTAFGFGKGEFSQTRWRFAAS